MLKFAFVGVLCAAALFPSSAISASAGTAFQASLTIAESCRIDSNGTEPQIACLHASAWRVDGSTITF